MVFVNKGGGDEERSNRESPGGKPNFGEIEFDPNDPDTVKVHYDVTGWSFEQRAELAETLAEREAPHVWEGNELVVPEAIEEPIDALFEELEQEIGPFPVALPADENGTEFGLDEWPAADLEMLRSALIEAEIPHRWEGTSSIIVAVDAEDAVDDLLDAIEAGDVATMDEVAPDGALHDLHRAADQLRRQPSAADARETILRMSGDLSVDAPPFGLAVTAWRTILARTEALREVFTSGNADPELIAEAATELRDACRPWV